MKFTITSSQSQPISFNNNTARTAGFCYEPTSVLDLRRSPSPIAAHDYKPVSNGTEISTISDVDRSAVQWDDNLLHNLDDWDSVMRDLGLHDDSVSNSITPSHHHQQQQQMIDSVHNHNPNPNHQFMISDFNFADISLNHNHGQTVNQFESSIGFDFVEELIRAAGCFDSNELQLGEMILARLNQRLRSPNGKPIQRAAFYFKEALLSLLTNSTPSIRSSSSGIVSTIKAYKAFSGSSPVPMFSNFTANQAILEAVEGPEFVHIIDFDLGFGGQYASLMKEIADRSEFSVIRITAIVPEEYTIEMRLIRENLCQFAQELRLNFHIECVSFRTFELLSFKSIKFVDGEKIVVQLSSMVLQRIGTGFVTDLRRISPSVVVYVDSEGCADQPMACLPSFRRSFMEGLEFYSVLLESLDAATRDGYDWVRKIENSLLRPKIFAVVEAAAERRVTKGREVLIGAGMRPMVLSQFAEFQAECLLRKAQIRGFHVAKRQGELLLCWNGRPLVATSAWRC